MYHRQLRTHFTVVNKETHLNEEIHSLLSLLSPPGTMPTLAIVSPDDRPVFEATFPQAFSGKQLGLEQMVLHSSLDMVDEKVSCIC